MHNALLAHASAVDVFRKGGYKGRIGIKIDGTPAVPLDPTSKKDQDAVVRSNDFEVFIGILLLWCSRSFGVLFLRWDGM